LVPVIRGFEFLDSGGFGVESEEVVSKLGKVRTSKAGSEVGGGMGLNDSLGIELESFVLRVVCFGEEVTGV
jgi:hypothetical protein